MVFKDLVIINNTEYFLTLFLLNQFTFRIPKYFGMFISHFLLNVTQS